MLRGVLRHLRGEGRLGALSGRFFNVVLVFIAALAGGVAVFGLTGLDAFDPGDGASRGVAAAGLAALAVLAGGFAAGTAVHLVRASGEHGRDSVVVMLLLAAAASAWTGRGAYLIGEGWAVAPAIGWTHRGGATRVEVEGADLYVAGELTTFVADRVRRQFARNPRIRTLHIDSGGGSLAAGEMIGDLVRRRGVDVMVAYECSSACGWIFLSGARRIMAPGARLGCHQAAHVLTGESAGESGAFRDFAVAAEARAARDALAEACDETPPERIFAPPLGALAEIGAVTHIGWTPESAVPARRFCAARPRRCA
jgi:hypothetical protein